MRLLRWLVVTEVNGWRSLFFLLTRRVPGRRPGMLTFGYAKELGPVIGAFIFGSALELVVVHLLLPWETIRLIADILSLWGLLWMFGYLAKVIVHPHLVGPDELRVRYGPSVDHRIPWGDVAEVKATRRRGERRGDEPDERRCGAPRGERFGCSSTTRRVSLRLVSGP